MSSNDAKTFLPESQQTPPEETTSCHFNRRCWVGFVAIILLLIGIAGVTVTCFVLEQKVLQYNHHYGVIFDAGSSHTDIGIYRWPSGYKDHGTAHTQQLAYEKCSDTGISSYEHNPHMAGEMIKKCIDTVALRVLPHRDVKKTAIYVGATAGMRLLCKRDHTKCSQIKDSIRRALNKYKFRETKNRVRVLTGKEEATFGWITANLLNGALHKRLPASNNTYLVGALDMGGGSSEVAFVPENISLPDDYRSHVRLYGVNYTLYTHSYLCFGFKEAQRRLMAHILEASNFTRKVIHPCWQKGYNESIPEWWIWQSPCSKRPRAAIFPLRNASTFTFVGNGSSSACSNRINDLFNETVCSYGSCSFDGVYQPTLRGHFMAYSGYGHIGTFLNITKGDLISEIKNKGDDLCGEQWRDVSHGNPSIATKYLRNYCFEALYSYGMLTRGLHFKPDSNDVFIHKEVEGSEVGWAMGFMVNATNSIPVEEPMYRLTQQEFVGLLVVCCLISLVGLALFTVCLVKRRIERNLKYKYTRVNESQ